MQKIIFLKGLQASGKSTWAKQYCKDNPDFIRVNKDDIRKPLQDSNGGKWNKTIEKETLYRQNLDILCALNDGYNVIIDNTHFEEKHKTNIQKFLAEYGFVVGENLEWEDKYFECLLPEAIERDKKRENPVGKQVILNTFKKYLWKEHVMNPDLETVIWCDCDGSLCLYEDKNPYNRDFSLDEINYPVLWILKQWVKNEGKVYFMTGRKESATEQTLDFLLNKCLFNPDEFKLFTRKEDDKRRDYYIKYDLWKENIENKVNVWFAIDDRKQIKYLLYQLGIPCFDVNFADLEY